VLSDQQVGGASTGEFEYSRNLVFTVGGHMDQVFQFKR
jgi:hypothetical protein